MLYSAECILGWMDIFLNIQQFMSEFLFPMPVIIIICEAVN